MKPAANQSPPKLTSIERSIARRIAELRKETGMTLRELGERTDLSSTYLSRVENGQSSVTIANLNRIAEVFATPIHGFLKEAEQQQNIEICRAGNGHKARFRGRQGTLASLIAQNLSNKMMEPLIVHLSDSPSAINPQGHAGEELNYVLDGKCNFVYGTDIHELNTGDSVYFDATVPHAIHKIDAAPCSILAVVTSRDFQAHTDIIKVLENRVQI